MNTPTSDSPKVPGLPATADQRRYQPPRLTGKLALEQVTLFSFHCTPPDPRCPIGHP
jgi:hypothetical protein